MAAAIALLDHILAPWALLPLLLGNLRNVVSLISCNEAEAD